MKTSVAVEPNREHDGWRYQAIELSTSALPSLRV
jgi:hypothetical protein